MGMQNLQEFIFKLRAKNLRLGNQCLTATLLVKAKNEAEARKIASEHNPGFVFSSIGTNIWETELIKCSAIKKADSTEPQYQEIYFDLSLETPPP